MKAERLLNSSGSICVAPGMEDGMCVASAPGSKPHIVSKSKKGSLNCDEACLAWKSQRLCSHIVAVAEEKGCLNAFLMSYRRAKIQRNYTAVSMHSQSKNVGKKPGCPNLLWLALGSGSLTVVSEPHCSTSSLATPFGPIKSQPLALRSQPTASISSHQICHCNLQPQNVTSSFQCSPLPVAGAASRRATQPTVVVSHPFQVKILTPAIKICAGCRNGYTGGVDGIAPPPLDLCLVHKEQHLYYNVVNAKQYKYCSWKRGNEGPNDNDRVVLRDSNNKILTKPLIINWSMAIRSCCLSTHSSFVQEEL